MRSSWYTTSPPGVRNTSMFHPVSACNIIVRPFRHDARAAAGDAARALVAAALVLGPGPRLDLIKDLERRLPNDERSAAFEGNRGHLIIRAAIQR